MVPVAERFECVLQESEFCVTVVAREVRQDHFEGRGDFVRIIIPIDREIAQQDEDIETHFKDITVSTESVFDVFVRFLAAAKFLNGFETMMWLNIGNRIKWMKICAILWHAEGRKISGFRFESDHNQAALELDRRLLAVDESQLNRYLVQIDAGVSPDSFPDIYRINKQYSAFGIRFSPRGAGMFEINHQ